MFDAPGKLLDSGIGIACVFSSADTCSRSFSVIDLAACRSRTRLVAQSFSQLYITISIDSPSPPGPGSSSSSIATAEPGSQAVTQSG